MGRIAGIDRRYCFGTTSFFDITGRMIAACLLLSPTYGLPSSAAAAVHDPVTYLQPAEQLKKALNELSRVSKPIIKRYENDHIVLADCRDASEVLSSQMAYYEDGLEGTPKDVAIVDTPYDQTRVWVNANTSAQFSTTGVWFNASIGPKVPEGQFAGVGRNDYENFTCWQEYRANLYVYDGTQCHGVYDCRHQAIPENVTWVPPGVHRKEDKMSKGTIIGIAVGVAGGVLFLIAAVLVFWYYRRLHKGKEASSQDEAQNAVDDTQGDKGAPVLMDTNAICEIDGRRYRVEMSDETGKVELDAHEKAELPGDFTFIRPAVADGEDSGGKGNKLGKTESAKLQQEISASQGEPATPLTASTPLDEPPSYQQTQEEHLKRQWEQEELAQQEQALLHKSQQLDPHRQTQS